MALVAVFDFLSHAQMHLPFNEGYLRTLRAAFPEDEIIFCGIEGQVSSLRARMTGVPNLQMQAIRGFTVPFGVSRHHPVGGWLAARACLTTLKAAIAGKPLRLAVVMGAEANIQAAIRRGWPGISAAPLHIILHNYIAVSTQWRSRNPLNWLFDMQAELQRPLPTNVKLVTLELGIAEAVSKLAPSMTNALVTLEHPIAEGDWSDAIPSSGPMKIGFPGNAGIDKGFMHFLDFARSYGSSKLEFHAIGLAPAPSRRPDMSALATPASPDLVPRDAYAAQLAACDLVCLPLSPIYDYVASGSVIDAIATLKPIYAVHTTSYDRMTERYGPFGVLANDTSELGEIIGALSRPQFAAESPRWIANLRNLREARRPACLAADYRRLVRHSSSARAY